MNVPMLPVSVKTSMLVSANDVYETSTAVPARSGRHVVVTGAILRSWVMLRPISVREPSKYSLLNSARAGVVRAQHYLRRIVHPVLNESNAYTCLTECHRAKLIESGQDPTCSIRSCMSPGSAIDVARVACGYVHCNCSLVVLLAKGSHTTSRTPSCGSNERMQYLLHSTTLETTKTGILASSWQLVHCTYK
jgi:hypothetical protein